MKLKKLKKQLFFSCHTPYTISHWDCCSMELDSPAVNQERIASRSLTSLHLRSNVHCCMRTIREKMASHPESRILLPIYYRSTMINVDVCAAWAWSLRGIYYLCELSHPFRRCHDPSSVRIARPPRAHSQWRSWHALAPALDGSGLQIPSMPVTDGCLCISGRVRESCYPYSQRQSTAKIDLSSSPSDLRDPSPNHRPFDHIGSTSGMTSGSSVKRGRLSWNLPSCIPALWEHLSHMHPLRLCCHCRQRFFWLFGVAAAEGCSPPVCLTAGLVPHHHVHKGSQTHQWPPRTRTGRCPESMTSMVHSISLASASHSIDLVSGWVWVWAL